VPALLFAAFAAGLFAASCAGDALAKSNRERPMLAPATEVVQVPAPAPRQFFATKGVEPLTPEIEQALKPKDSFKECEACPEMVVVPKGSFIMGTPLSEVDRYKGEDPLHQVTLARPFAVGAHVLSSLLPVRARSIRKA